MGNSKIFFGGAVVIVLLLVAVVGPAIAPYDFRELNVAEPLSGPSIANWFGTDINGRDLLSRLLVGTRTVVGVPVLVGLATVLLGLPLGLVAGYLGGSGDQIVMRSIDVLLSLPWLLVALGLASVIGPGYWTVVIALTVVYTPQVARLTRNASKSVAGEDYVIAAQLVGERPMAIMVRYVLRNCYFPILVLVTTMLAFAILNESGISFLGFGIQSPRTSWGLELAEGTRYISVAPHLVIFPGLFIAIAVFGLNFLGDGLNDLFNQRKSAS